MSPERVLLAPGYTICPLIQGCWQWAAGHNPSGLASERELDRMVELGATTFDCADIYLGVEELLGRWLRRSPRRAELQVHTKCVPDLAVLPRVDRRQLEAIVDRSLRRLGVERLDLVQFHWWDWSIPGHLDALGQLEALRAAGKIRHLGVTNYDAAHLLVVIRAGLPVVANQVQYSLLDRRPEHGAPSLVEVCLEHGVGLFAYGALAGGLIDPRTLEEEPGATPLNRSQVKYRLIIDEAGGPPALRDLLRVLAEVGERRATPPVVVALRFMLDRPAVRAVIVGSRSAARFATNRAAFGWRLGPEDTAALDRWLRAHPGPAGPVYGLERDRTGPHGRIMRYDSNREQESEGV